MKALDPLYTGDLFSPLHRELIGLLRGLETGDWLRRTIAGSWRVRDVVAHMLDGDLRRLSAQRDGHRRAPDRPVRSYGELVDWINEMNSRGVEYASALSPRLMTDLLEQTGGWVAEVFAALPPHEESIVAVAWAGEQRSENWMDIGREYTERWHHQMQIRDAVGRPGLMEGRWASPVFNLSVRALPRAYSNLEAPSGTAVLFEIVGNGGGVWSVVREPVGWRVLRGAASDPAAVVLVDPEMAWRLFYNALSPAEARARATITGNSSLADPIFHARSVMV